MSDRVPGDDAQVDAVAERIANVHIDKMRADRAKAKAVAKERRKARRANGDGADDKNWRCFHTAQKNERCTFARLTTP